MEGDSEDSDEDIQRNDRLTVLWEKCIQQSIFVDLSEDESIHFSDLESSFDLHLSEAESAASEQSIHLSGSIELSALDDTSSESSSVRSTSMRVQESKAKSGALHVSAQRPNTMQSELPINQGDEDPGQNTSDEDQEDLPYDGDIGSPYINQTVSSEGNTSSDGRRTVQASPELPGVHELLQQDTNTEEVENFKSNEGIPPYPGPADINQMLLRHFSKEELLQSSWQIEAETLPEASLLDSMDYTALSSAPTHNSSAANSNQSESTDEESAASKTANSEEDEKRVDHLTSASTDSNISRSARTDSNQSGGDISVEGIKQEKTEEDDELQRVHLVRARSFSEMKYGQGQVHYPLPDFSRVAPKVKLPKAPSGPTRSSTIHRAQSSPGTLEVISRVLEDSVQPSENPYVFKDNDKQTPPALVHHLQAEYDKLLTKYAEAENLIDQMRLGTNPQPSSDLMLCLEHDSADQGESAEERPLGYLAPHLPPSKKFTEKVEATLPSASKEVPTASMSHEDDTSDGERMTAELSTFVSHFMQKVEEFNFSLRNMVMSIAEQQMMLRSMMEAQDQLERKYIRQKEEHRALEMQNYMGLSRNIGTFDPDRLVEGDIFRIGMQLEDIKEIIDKNACEQIYPPRSSSTPTPVTMPMHVKLNSHCVDRPSPSSSLHEGSGAGFSTVSYQMNLQKEVKEEVEELPVDSGLVQRPELITDDSQLKIFGCNSCYSRDSLSSLEGRDIQIAGEDEEGIEEEKISVLSGMIDHNNILAYLRGASSTSKQRQWASDSDSSLDGVLRSQGEGDLVDCVSLTVEVSCSFDAAGDSDSHSLSDPPLNTSCVSRVQRIVSPETDSGFGSSYLNQLISGPFQPNLLTERAQPQNESLSTSDSDGSCSNLQTTIIAATLTEHQGTSLHSAVQIRHRGEAAEVELWVESTSEESSDSLQGSDQNLATQHHHHRSNSVFSSTMENEDRDNQVFSCSCHSEVIVALQSEVSQLKKDLEEGLIQLPHLAQKMDYLASKYKQEHQGRRCKSRTHKKSTSKSVERSSSSGVSNLGSCQVKIEDWISTDMDPSKSKDTNSGDTSCSEMTLHVHISPVGSRRGGCSAPESKQTMQSKAETKGIPGLKRGNDGANESHVIQSPQPSMKSFYSKDRWALFSSASLEKPLLQINYGSSSSLPASYKMWEPPLQSTSHHRKHFTQSDSALLPSNVYFQQTGSPLLAASKTNSRTSRHRGNKEEDMNRTLNQAIEVARSMKKTTDRMARRLSANLAKAQIHRKLPNMQPLGGRKHQAL